MNCKLNNCSLGGRGNHAAPALGAVRANGSGGPAPAVTRSQVSPVTTTECCREQSVVIEELLSVEQLYLKR